MQSLAGGREGRRLDVDVELPPYGVAVLDLEGETQRELLLGTCGVCATAGARWLHRTVYSTWDAQVPHASKMSGLDPCLATGRTGARLAGTPHRKPQPGLRLEALATLFEAAFEHQDFHTAGIGKRDGSAGRPAFEANVLVGILEQGHQLDVRAVRRSEKRHLARVETHVGTVLGGELPELHEQNAARRRPRRVRGGGWVSDV